MSVHFDSMPSPNEMVTYMTWRPPLIPSVRRWPGTFDATGATPGALTLRTGGSMRLDGATPWENPRFVFVPRHVHRCRLSIESTEGPPLDPSPPSRPRIDAGPSISRLGASPLSGPSSRVASQGRSCSSGRASPSYPRSACGHGRGRRVRCCRGEDDLDDRAHIRSSADQ
jgi:hypothetical protein